MRGEELRSLVARLGYPPAWVDSELLPAGFLSTQAAAMASMLASDLRGTEHWRAAAFELALVSESVLSGTKLSVLLDLLEADPDRGLAASYSWRLVGSRSPLSRDLVLVAARHRAMGLGVDAFEDAHVRLHESGLPIDMRIGVARQQLDFADAWTQERILKRGVATIDVHQLLVKAGKNANMRRFARHGLWRRLALQRPPEVE